MATDENRKSQYKFPSNSTPDKIKNTKDWGLTVANAIEGRWFAKESNTSQFYVNRNRYHTLRLYAKGDQDIRRYKDEFSLNGDLSYLNLDWTPVPIVPKFVDIVVNGMQDREFQIQANAVDPVATAERKNYLEVLKAEMEAFDDLMELQEGTGVEVFENDPDTIPGSMEELELHMALDYKQNVELAMESAINYELKINEYENTKYRVDYDLTTIGIGSVKHQFIPGEGIKVEYVDPANLVYSDTDSQFYDDITYAGEVKRIHVTELQKQFPGLSAHEVEILENIGGSIADNYNAVPYNRDQGDEGYVDVIFFSYKTVNSEVYKMVDKPMGYKKAIEKDDTFNPPKDKRAGHSKVARVNEVIYEGVKVVGRDILLKWELAKNMIRPDAHSPKCILPYVIASPKQYKGKIYSLVKRMEKYADAIQLINLKIQQVIQKMTPSGVFLDVDGLAEIDLGNGTSYNPQTALDMYFQTGSVIGRSLTADGDFNNGKVPIQELPGSGGQQIQVLLGAYEYNLNQIRNVTGLNEARDGSTPDPEALVGVQKLAAANSNTATRHILKSSTYITRRLAEGVALRVADVLEYAPNKEDYIQAIGKHNVEILDDIADMHLSEFGIFIELGPDGEEMAKLEAMLQAAIGRGELKPEDVIDIQRIKNIKLANQMLKVKRKQRDEVEQAKQMQLVDQQNQGLAQVAQQTEAAKAQAAQLSAQSEGQLEQLKSQLKQQQLDFETEKEKELLLFKHNLQLDLMGVQQTHEDTQNTKSRDADMKKEKLKQGQSSSISIDNKANTVDGKVRTGGLL